MTGDKKTEQVKVWMPEDLFRDLSRLAHAEDRKLSDFICVALSRMAYGHLARLAENNEGANRPDSGRE